MRATHPGESTAYRAVRGWRLDLVFEHRRLAARNLFALTPAGSGSDWYPRPSHA